MRDVFDPFDVESVRQKLAGFIAAQGLADVSVGPLRRYTVGFSWVTYGFHAAWRDGAALVERDLILRAGPPNGIFAPYKASPEFLTLGALANSGVPVPGVYWYDDSGDVLGAPFFVCDLVPGEAPIPWTHDGGPAFDDATRESLGGQFVAALAALHNFEWRDTPAAGIDGSTDVEARSLCPGRPLGKPVAAVVGAARADARMGRDLAAGPCTAAPKISIVHGDFRIGNFLEAGGRITAILDWELVRLGDPIEDLGWICLQAWRGRSPYMCHFFTREELRDRYAALTGIEVGLDAIRYWEVFGTYKLAVMHYGATHCFEARGFNDLRMAGMGAQIPRMLLQLETAMDRAA